MTDKEILTAAITKAVKHGYDRYQGDVFTQRVELDYPHWSPFVFIFSHDFAKAFWSGTQEWMNQIQRFDRESNELGSGYVVQIPDWKHHLQEMAIDSNPTQYLAKFL